MRLSVARCDLAFPLLRPASEDLWPWRGGTPVSTEWDQPSLTLAEGQPKDFIAVDCMELIAGSDGFVLSDFARSKLESLLAPAGEFWPVSVLGLSYWWFNCLACVEALDRERTDADWSVVDGAWGSFKWITTTRRLAFTRSKLQSSPAVFRIPEYPQGVLFSTDALVSAVEDHQLTGFRFDAIWSAEEGGVADPPGVSLNGVFETVNRTEIRRRRAQASSILQRRTGGGA